MNFGFQYRNVQTWLISFNKMYCNKNGFLIKFFDLIECVSFSSLPIQLVFSLINLLNSFGWWCCEVEGLGARLITAIKNETFARAGCLLVYFTTICRDSRAIATVAAAVGGRPAPLATEDGCLHLIHRRNAVAVEIRRCFHESTPWVEKHPPPKAN